MELGFADVGDCMRSLNSVQKRVGGYVGMVAMGEGRVQKRQAIACLSNDGKQIVAMNSTSEDFVNQMNRSR